MWSYLNRRECSRKLVVTVFESAIDSHSIREAVVVGPVHHWTRCGQFSCTYKPMQTQTCTLTHTHTHTHTDGRTHPNTFFPGGIRRWSESLKSLKPDCSDDTDTTQTPACPLTHLHRTHRHTQTHGTVCLHCVVCMRVWCTNGSDKSVQRRSRTGKKPKTRQPGRDTKRQKVRQMEWVIGFNIKQVKHRITTGGNCAV